MVSWREVPITLGTDGAYHAKVQVGHKANGLPDRRHRSGKTAADVRRKIRELLREVEAGRKPRVGRTPTVEEWFTTWLTTIAPVGAKALAPKTLDDYWSLCRNWVFPHLGGLRIDAMEPEDLDRLYGAMYAKKTSEGRVLKAHAVVRRGLEIALRRGHLARNVAKMIDPPGSPTSAREALSTEESRRVLDVARRRRNGARWFLGMAIGPRQGETLGLRWSDLTLDARARAGHVSIQWQIQRLRWQHGCDDPHACGARPTEAAPKGHHRNEACRPGCKRHPGVKGCPPPCPATCEGHASSCPQRRDGGLVLSRPKGWRRRRNPQPRLVALPPSLVDMLVEHRRRQDAEREAAESWWSEEDFVFCHEDGRPVDPRVDWGEWKSILREAGVGDARVHAMRHSAATALTALGVDSSVIQEILGHADIRTTRGYQDVSVDMTRGAAAQMDTLLTPPEQPEPPRPGSAVGMASVTDLVTERARRRSA